MAGISFLLDRRPWATFVALMTAVVAIQLVTLGIDPPINQDEVQIVDYGRTALHPSSNWSITWNVPEQIPVLSTSYVAVAIQELVYRASGQSLLGPRISAAMGAVVTALCCFGWLRARRTPTAVALLLAVLLLVDPVFSEIYRQGRVDGYAMAAALGACWLFRLAEARVRDGNGGQVQLAAAGVLTGLSPFLWATAPMLFPLIALEAFYVVKARWDNTSRLGLSVGILVPAAVGFALVLACLAVPIVLDAELYWEGAQSSAAVQSRASVIKNSVVHLFLTHDPALSLIFLASVIFCREFGLFIALALAMVMMHQTMIYLPRVLYLMPYMLVIIASAYSRISVPGRSLLLQRWLGGLLGFCVLASVVWVLGLRPWLAHKMLPANDPAQIAEALEKSIGRGEFRVLLESWEAYYAGRALGWEMYRAGSPVPAAQYLEFAKSMDFAVLPIVTSYQNINPGQLTEIGFVLHEEIDFANCDPIELPWYLYGIRVPCAGYPGFQVYASNRRFASPRS